MNMRHTEILRVRKQIVAVDIALAGLPPRPVEVFLAENDIRQYRRQQLLDLLEHGPPFVPVRDSAEARWDIVNRDLVVWVRVPPASLAVAGEEADELFDIRQKVDIELTSGPALSGELLYSAEETLTRVTDYMNQQGRFFRLWKGEDLYFVHKPFVIRVIERN
jgi:hypothetical protein